MSETDSMIERVAKALFPVYFSGIPKFDTPENRAAAFAVARVAIEAMREPTTEMYEAGQNEVSHFDGEFGDYNVYFSAQQIDDLWPAMIDAALNPPANT